MTRLVNLLIAKSILETILVGTIAVVVYLNAFPPTFQVGVKRSAGRRVSRDGLLVIRDPWRRVEVQLFIDGKLDRNAGGPTLAA